MKCAAACRCYLHKCSSSNECKLRRQVSHDLAVPAGVRRRVALPLVSAAARWWAWVVVILTTCSRNIARELQGVDGVLRACPSLAQAMVVMHAAAIRMHD